MYDVQCTLVENSQLFRIKAETHAGNSWCMYACIEEQSTKRISRDAVHNFIRVSRVVQRQTLDSWLTACHA